MPTLADNEILIKVCGCGRYASPDQDILRQVVAIAQNPTDWKRACLVCLIPETTPLTLVYAHLRRRVP